MLIHCIEEIVLIKYAVPLDVLHRDKLNEDWEIIMINLHLLLISGDPLGNMLTEH